MSAKDIILKAASCENSGYILEAEKLFEEAVHVLGKLVDEEGKVEKKQIYQKRFDEYATHVEQIKEQLQQHTINSKLIDQIHILEHSCGNSYQKLFGQYMNESIKEVVIYEPYLTERFHFKNLICFLELVVKSCRQLKYVRVVTKIDSKLPKNQLGVLQQIRSDMAQGGISFNFTIDNALHDRKIVLSNGIIIKIGRGLHFYQPVDPVYSLGLCDYDFRRCLQTDVDIWRARPFIEDARTSQRDYNESGGYKNSNASTSHNSPKRNINQ